MTTLTTPRTRHWTDQLNYTKHTTKLLLTAYFTGIEPPKAEKLGSTKPDPANTSNLHIAIIDIGRSYERSGLSRDQKIALRAVLEYEYTLSKLGGLLSITPEEAAELHDVALDTVVWYANGSRDDRCSRPGGRR